MYKLGVPLLLAEIPWWGTGLALVAAIVGGILVSRRFAAREAFADSHVTMGVLGFAGLIALGSVVPGLFFDLDRGARFLLGLGLSMIYGFARQAGGHLQIRSERLPGSYPNGSPMTAFLQSISEMHRHVASFGTADVNERAVA